MNKLETPICPLCGNGKFHVSLKSRDFLHSKEEFTVVRCSSCGVLYTNPRIRERDIHAYYPPEYCSFSVKPDKKSFTFKLRKLAGKIFGNANIRLLKFLKTLGAVRVLEIGAGTGELLYLLKDNGLDVTGVETDRACVRQINDNGVKCVYGDLSNVQAVTGSKFFDAIILHHTFEHLYKPKQGLEQISGLLKDSGALFISLPNAGSVESNLFGRYWRGLDLPRHIVHYDKGTITRILSDAGFISVRVRPVSFPSSFAESIGLALFSGKLPVFLYYGVFY